MNSGIPAVLLAVACSFCAPRLLAGQSLDAVLKGRICDETGAGLPGGIVTVSTADSSTVRSATTDSAGYYVLFSLPAGTYDVRGDLDGFSPQQISAQTLYVGTSVTIDFILTVGGLTERVEVRSEGPLLETSRNTLSRIVQGAEIDALPVISRNFNDLAALAPGVTRTGTYGGVDISGSRDFQNGYQVDGVSAEGHALGDQRMPYAQDWIQEFQVLTAQFDAEFGQAAGGVLNAITRSGGNRFAGRLYGFLRNDAWDATPAFLGRKPPLDEQRIGGTAGGPVVRNRVFYFAGFERFSGNSSNVVNSAFAESNGAFPSTVRQTLSLAKLDVVARQADRIRLRYNGQRGHATGSSVGGISTQEHGRSSEVRGNELLASWTSVVSAVALNEARVAWSSSVPTEGCNFANDNPAGTWFERAYPGAQFGCPVNFGTIAERQLQVVDNFSLSRGRHDLKLGAQAFSTHSFGDFRNFRDGRYSFERDLPFSLENPNSHPFSYARIEGPTVWDVSGWSSGVFLQDSWRVTDALSLNLGLRYDLDGTLTALNPVVRTDRGIPVIRKDRNNVAPRIGAVWTPFEHRRGTQLRGGTGLYYDQNHGNVSTAVLLNNVLVDRTIVVNANSPALNPFWPDIQRAKHFLAEGLAANRAPDTAGLPGLLGATNSVDPGLEIPATLQASGGLVHEFRPGVTASADAVYARGFDLYVIRDVNLQPVTFESVNPNYSAILAFGNGGRNVYRALQMQVNVVDARQRLLKVAFTVAANRGNTDATLSGGVATNPFDYGEDEGPTDNDVRRTLAVNGSTPLRFGLQLSGIFSYRSGLPYSATSDAPRPDGKPFAFRPEPRNGARGGSALSADLRLAKMIRRGARHSASLFLEAFNLTNRVSYGGYIGTVTSTLFGRPTTAEPRRRLQVGFRVEF